MTGRLRARLMVTLTIALTVLAATTVSSITMAGAAAKCPKGTIQRPDEFGNAFVCVPIEKGSPGSPGGPPLTEGQRWHVAGCSTFAAYLDGYTLSYNDLGAAAGGEVDTSSWHVQIPTSVGPGELIDVTSAVSNPPAGARRYAITCDAAGQIYQRTATVIPGAAPVDPRVLLAAAVANLQVPATDPGSNPDRTNPDRFGVVNIPVWLWINGPWAPVVSSDTQFGVTVTATATPKRAIWDMGNGEQKVCLGPGVEWQTGLDDNDTDCFYTYTTSSAGLPGDAYEITAGVTWDYTWSINTVPQGQFGTYQALTPFTYQVGEIQAIES